MDHSAETTFQPAGRVVPERHDTCPSHGEFVSRNLVARVWSRCPTCADQEHTAEAEAKRAADLQKAEARHREMLEAARIPERFIDRTLANFTADSDAQRHALDVVGRWVRQASENRRSDAGLILSGDVGTGKTHLLCAAAQALPTPGVRYMTAMEIVRAVRDTWRKDAKHSEAGLLDYFERLDLLVVDELGAQYGTDSEQQILFEVVDRRYRARRPVLLATNQDRAGLKRIVGDRTFDRLTETCTWVPFDWPSHRPAARKAARSGA